MIAAGTSASTVLTFITAFIAICGFSAAAIAAVFFVSKSRGTQDSLASLQTTNEAMQTALDFERAEREHDKVAAETVRARDKAECDSQIAHLRGKVEAMEAKQVDGLVEKVGVAMDTTITTMLDRLDETLTAMAVQSAQNMEATVEAAVSHGVEAGLRAANG